MNRETTVKDLYEHNNKGKKVDMSHNSLPNKQFLAKAVEIYRKCSYDDLKQFPLEPWEKNRCKHKFCSGNSTVHNCSNQRRSACDWDERSI